MRAQDASRFTWTGRSLYHFSQHRGDLIPTAHFQFLGHDGLTRNTASDSEVEPDIVRLGTQIYLDRWAVKVRARRAAPRSYLLGAAAFLGNISPMRRIWAPTPFSFSSMCS